MRSTTAAVLEKLKASTSTSLSTAEVAREAGMTRGKAYGALLSLLKKEMVEKVPGKPVRWKLL